MLLYELSNYCRSDSDEAMHEKPTRPQHQVTLAASDLLPLRIVQMPIHNLKQAVSISAVACALTLLTLHCTTTNLHTLASWCAASALARDPAHLLCKAERPVQALPHDAEPLLHGRISIIDEGPGLQAAHRRLQTLQAML